VAQEALMAICSTREERLAMWGGLTTHEQWMLRRLVVVGPQWPKEGLEMAVCRTLAHQELAHFVRGPSAASGAYLETGRVIATGLGLSVGTETGIGVAGGVDG
jgi:hypothetical protein